MQRYIEYEKTRCKSLVFKISPSSGFQNILTKLNSIEFTGCNLTNEQITYAVLELINNSLRAHREADHDLPIRLRFMIDEKGLEIYLQDWGGGFDISKLPYNIHEDATEIDVHDDRFENYRNEHGYQRFGLGLYLAKKTFNYFSIFFIDENGSETTWESGNSAGTVVRLRTYSYTPTQNNDEVFYEEPARL